MNGGELSRFIPLEPPQIKSVKNFGFMFRKVEILHQISVENPFQIWPKTIGSEQKRSFMLCRCDARLIHSA